MVQFHMLQLYFSLSSHFTLHRIAIPYDLWYIERLYLYTLPQKKRNFSVPIFHSALGVPTLI